MKTIFDSIGDRWEDVLEDSFPSLERNESEDQRLPDFYHPDGFYIEAKAGNRLWGGRVKPAQLDHAKKLDRPVIYAFGMHDLDNAKQVLNQDTEEKRKDFLEKNMHFVEVYFISGSLVRKIFVKERRLSKKEGLVYCMIKPSTLRNIILDRKFKRFGEDVQSSSKYYGFNRRDYEIGFEDGLGFILHKGREREAINSLL
jgi:hypothetical protein